MSLNPTLSLLSRPLTMGVLAALTLLPLTGMAQEAPQMSLERVKLSAGMHQIDAQVAATPNRGKSD